MRYFGVLAFLLLGVGQAWSQSVTLPATINVPAAGLVVITPDKVDGDDAAFLSLDAGLQLIPQNLLKSNTTAIGFAMTTGSYRVACVVAKVSNGKAMLSDIAMTTVVVGGTPPGPGPGPSPPVPPGPQPNPTPPLTGKLWFVTVEDAANRTKAFADVVGDFQLWQDAEKAGHRWRVYDKDSDGGKVNLATLGSKAPPLPFLLVIQQDGSFNIVSPYPATSAEMRAVFKKYAAPKKKAVRK